MPLLRMVQVVLEVPLGLYLRKVPRPGLREGEDVIIPDARLEAISRNAGTRYGEVTPAEVRQMVSDLRALREALARIESIECDDNLWSGCCGEKQRRIARAALASAPGTKEER